MDGLGRRLSRHARDDKRAIQALADATAGSPREGRVVHR
jgi:hypothetical protein